MADPSASATDLVLGHELSELQAAVLENNFDSIGPFFFGKDLHPMLDCANLRDRMDFFED